MGKRFRGARKRAEIDELEFPGDVRVDGKRPAHDVLELHCKPESILLTATYPAKLSLSGVVRLRDVLAKYIEWRETQPEQEELT